MTFYPLQNTGTFAFNPVETMAFQQRLSCRQGMLAEHAFMPVARPSQEEMIALQSFYFGCQGDIQQIRYGSSFPDLSSLMMQSQSQQMMLFFMLAQQIQMQNNLIILALLQQGNSGNSGISQLYSGNGNNYSSYGTGNNTPGLSNYYGGQTNQTASGNAAADLASQFIGRDSISIKGQLPNFTAAGGVTNNCADFVSSCLESTGRLQGHEINVGHMENSLKKQGYVQVPREQAQPGDVWISSSGGHTELVLEPGGTALIGSNGGKRQTVSVDRKSGMSGGRFYHKYA